MTCAHIYILEISKKPIEAQINYQSETILANSRQICNFGQIILTHSLESMSHYLFLETSRVDFLEDKVLTFMIHFFFSLHHPYDISNDIGISPMGCE